MSQVKIIRAGQAMYVLCNTETRSCNHRCSGKAMSITYSERVFVTLVIQHKMPMRYIFPHYLINDKIFKKKVFENKMRDLIFSTTVV
jgi:hypothetical protein